jgi:hypothetical protein
VTVPDLLDELELDVLSHLVVILADAKHVGDDVLRGVAQLPEVVHRLVRLVDVARDTVVQHVSHQEWVRLVTDLKEPGIDVKKTKIKFS